jgi:hypothetical protein
MSISWGAWEYSGGNGMRVGIEATMTSVSHSSSSCTVTFKIYTDNQYSYSDSQTLNISGTGGWGDVGFTNNDGGSAQLRSTKTYTYNFAAGDFGSGTAKNVTLTATISGAYNGVTPSKSVTVSIPNRPYAAAAPATWQDASWVNDSQVNIFWGLNSTAGEPIDTVAIDRWDNVSNTWTRIANIGYAGSYASTGLSANRRYQWRVLPGGPGGYAGAWAYSEAIQTTPATPSNCTVTANGVTGTIVNWTNGASTLNGYGYNSVLQRSVNGGAYATIATLGAGVTSYSDTGLNPGDVYQYQVYAQSTTEPSLASPSTTSPTIQLQQAPAAPTALTLTRNSDTSFTLAWTDNPNGDVAPYNSITVQRWDNVSNTWSTVASLAGTAATLTDTATVVNRRYQWRVRAENAAGPSAWTTTEFTQTTPTGPTITTVRAVAGGGVQVVWTNNVSYSTYTIGVRYYENGVLVDDTISVASGTTSYTVTGVDLSASYKFSVRAVSTVGANLDSGWVDSAEIPASTVPNAPSLLAPDGAVIDLALDQVFSWQHNPSVDASEQTSFEIQYSSDGGTNWTSLGQITGTANSYTLPAATLTNGVAYVWQVRTWGVNATASPWSTSAAITGSTTPTVTINSPDATLTISQIDVAWSYLDAESTAQSGWEVILLDADGSQLESKTGTDAATSLTLGTAALDGEFYTLRVRARDGSGLWSNWAELNITAAFTKPAPSILSADYSAGNGFVVLTLTPTEPEA